MRQVIDWLEKRTGIESTLRHFLYEDIPASSGWHQAFGSVAAFAFLMQVFTGILLAFNYAPTPGDAYTSLHYIVTELTGGSIIHALHHWGASMMIVTVVLHLIQVFVWGAYKKPREATWMLGVVLMLLTLAFGLTGYLLPWDNRAYWGTVVTTNITASAPIAGPYLARLLGGGGAIGVVTFARFYAMHVLLLPPLTMLLIGLHVFLVRRHGVTPEPEESAPPKKFFPEQVFKDTTAIFLYFAILVMMAVAVHIPMGHMADPNDTSFTPRPEWYFLFLFQTLKFFEGPLEVVGTVVLPTLAILLLFLVPFIDRGKALRVTRRFTAIGVVLLAGMGWGALTLAALRSTPPDTEGEDSGAPAWTQLSPTEVSGIAFFRSQNCEVCHSLTGAKAPGPDLTHIAADHKNTAWMIAHFKNPARMSPGSGMPPVVLSDSQLSALAAFVLKLSPENAASLQATPQTMVDGATVYEANGCSTCHVLNGEGTQLGPDLNGVASRHPSDWIQAHFRDPAKLSPGSAMPPVNFNDKDMNAITQYLMAIPKS